MNSLWSLTLDEYLEICEIAKENGVKPGESMELYFLAYVNAKKKKPIGNTELNMKELITEYVSKGKKVLNINKDGMKIIKPKEEE